MDRERTKVLQVLKKHEDEFFAVVDAKRNLLRLKRKKVITENLLTKIESADSADAKELLYDHLHRNADVAALREYCKMVIAADALPNMQRLGEKMLSELAPENKETLMEGLSGLYQPHYPTTPSKTRSGQFRDTPYGVAQEQPPSSGLAYRPGCEHQSMGSHPVAHSQDQSTGKLVGLATSDPPPPKFPYQESAGNDQMDQSTFRSTDPARAAYLQMERQNPQDPRVHQYRQKDIQEEMLMEEREREAQMVQEDAQRKKREIQRQKQEKAQLMARVQQEQLCSQAQKMRIEGRFNRQPNDAPFKEPEGSPVIGDLSPAVPQAPRVVGSAERKGPKMVAPLSEGSPFNGELRHRAPEDMNAEPPVGRLQPPSPNVGSSSTALSPNAIQELLQEKTGEVEALRKERNQFPHSPPAPQPLCYEMSSSPHGLAVIIIIDEVMFTPGVEAPQPPSSSVAAMDRTSLYCTLGGYLGYRVETYTNLNAVEITRKMKAVANRDHTPYDSFICCIIGCGKEDGVYGSDGEIVPLQEVVEALKGNSCPTLVGKPKMFFFQLNQGNAVDEGVQVLTKSLEADAPMGTVHSEADFFFVYAAGYQTDSDNLGSYFIRTLTDVITEKAQLLHLVDMLTEVSQRMARKGPKEGRGLQLPQVVSQLRKQVWFFTFRDTPYGVAQEQPPSSCSVYHPIDQFTGRLQQLRSRAQRMPVSDELCYPMRANPHGLCIIFNNVQFYATSSEEKLPDRNGSDVDQHNLSVIFSMLKYQVRSYKNYTAAQMMETMKEVSNTDHSSYDSLVCCMLTHGKKEGVFGADGTLVAVSDLASLVKAAYCSSLKGKPKMFFVEACRGDDEDKGVLLQSDDGEQSVVRRSLPNDAASAYCSTMKGKPKMFFVQACRGDDEDKGVLLQSNDGEQSVVRRSLPNDADFLFAYSTAPGTVSWKSPRYGSWYISKLCETLEQHATTGMDLVSMLTIVNDKVSEAYTKQGFKQCPAPVNMLRKKVVFC